MAEGFSEKQKWVATLEALVDHSGIGNKRKDAVRSNRPDLSVTLQCYISIILFALIIKLSEIHYSWFDPYRNY